MKVKLCSGIFWLEWLYSVHAFSLQKDTNGVITGAGRNSNSRQIPITVDLHFRRDEKPSRTRLLSEPSKDSTTPASQYESIVYNAKLLSPLKRATPLKKRNLPPGEPKSTTEQDTVGDKWIQSSAAGLAVALAMVPEAIAFSFVAGVNPLTGLWTTVILGFIAASFGGRAGICSSASGACSVVVAGLCAAKGPAYLSACAILSGMLQIFGGVIGLGKFIRLVPHPVMLGFVNGLAILMTKAQLVHFKGLSLTTPKGAATYGIAALTMVLVKLIPKVTKVIPPTLGAVTVATVVARCTQLPAQTLADVAGASTFAGGWGVLPKFGIPAIPLTLETLRVVFPYAATMAAVGCIESLLTMQLLDGMADDGKSGSTRSECVGQGLGNAASGLFGGIGGCALLGQSIINFQSGGGISRWSGMSMALFLGMGIVAAAPLLGSVPVASLVGVMLLVCQSTFSWSSLRILRKIPKLDALVIALVSIVTVQRDLAQAVVAGTILNALGFAWKQSTSLSVSTFSENNFKEYRLHGPIFFGSTQQFTSLFTPKQDPDRVVLDFADCRVMDHSALQAIQNIVDKYGSMGKVVFLRHLSADCTKRMVKLKGELPPYEIVEGDPNTDPVYQVA